MFGRLKLASRAKKPYGKSYKDCVDKIVKRHADIMKATDSDPAIVDTVYDDAALQAVCDRAEDFGDDVIGYAAFALEYLTVFHPFVDGNKRTAFAVMMKILHDGGYRLRDDEFTQDLVLGVASGRYDRDYIENWLRKNVIVIRRVS